jgi:antitoxin component YwqK of YwqJK toxin-antitoxin module
MKENYKVVLYQSKNIQTETYDDEGTFVTKHYYNGKNAYVRELIYLKDGITKIKHTTQKGVISKVEHFENDKREGQETKYFISKADGSVKSTKIYHDGKLHGENITYNEIGKIIKHEVFSTGKCVLKYLREDSASDEITNVQIIDENNVANLPKIEYDKLQTYIQNNPQT